MKTWLGLALAALVGVVWSGEAWAQGNGAAPGLSQGQPMAQLWPVVTPNIVYTKDRPPATPKLEDLKLKESVTQYGITWTFAEPARVGRFVNGDYYVVGPVTVKDLDPKPIYGKEIPESELDDQDKAQPEDKRVRHGFMLNPPARRDVAYDSGTRLYFRPGLVQKLPVKMKAGDSLVATISMPQGLVVHVPLETKDEIGGYRRAHGDTSPTRRAAVLTCVGEPQPADAFRPGFCDRQAKIYLARNLKRELLPTLNAGGGSKVEEYVGYTQKPWVGTCEMIFEQPMENMPAYGREYARVVSIVSLMLCSNLRPEQKEPLLVNFVQIGIDLGAMIRSGHPGWSACGGHASGRKMPIVFAGMMLGDEQLANINKSFPKARFGEDEQTAYGDCWTGAKVVFSGFAGINEATGLAPATMGPYEHKPPKEWTGVATGAGRTGDKCSETYRRVGTSSAWIGEALALRLMRAEKCWNHDAFFDYCDRWMYEDDTKFQKPLKEVAGSDWTQNFVKEGYTWEPFVTQMWKMHRTDPGLPPTDGWKKQHDDSYLRKAIGQPPAGGKQ